MNSATYFTPISPERGATAILDGSHKYNGRTDPVYAELKDQFPVVQVTAGAGSIVLFTEALVHSAVPVLADERRVAAFHWMSVPWHAGQYVRAPYYRAPYSLDRIADEELRILFQPPTDEATR
jgi:ectoine hydroxylase-related dioxygenase (phytanoyl-CoA dioxygenase family)